MIAALVTAEVPALPLNQAGKYVAAAYIVLFLIVLIYVSIMAIRLGRIERDLGELLELSHQDEGDRAGGDTTSSVSSRAESSAV